MSTSVTVGDIMSVQEPEPWLCSTFTQGQESSPQVPAACFGGEQAPLGAQDSLVRSHGTLWFPRSSVQLLCEGGEKGTDLFLAVVMEFLVRFPEDMGCLPQLHPSWWLSVLLGGMGRLTFPFTCCPGAAEPLTAF